MEANELKHYGRKGMKWGLSIFGKKLSSLRKRKGDSDGETETKTKAPAKKSVKNMTDAELNAAINRARLEQQYKQYNPEEVSRGKKFVSTIGNDVLKPALINAGKNALQGYAEKKAKDLLGLNTKSDLDILKGKNDKLRAQKDYDELTKYFEDKNKSKSDLDNLKDENDRLKAERDNIIYKEYIEKHKKKD